MLINGKNQIYAILVFHETLQYLYTNVFPFNTDRIGSILYMV